MEDIVILLFSGVRGFCDKVEVSKVQGFANDWLAHANSQHKAQIADAIIKANYTITPEIETYMNKACGDFLASYSA